MCVFDFKHEGFFFSSSIYICFIIYLFIHLSVHSIFEALISVYFDVSPEARCCLIFIINSLPWAINNIKVDSSIFIDVLQRSCIYAQVEGCWIFYSTCRFVDYIFVLLLPRWLRTSSTFFFNLTSFFFLSVLKAHHEKYRIDEKFPKLASAVNVNRAQKGKRIIRSWFPHCTYSLLFDLFLFALWWRMSKAQ